MVVRRPTTLMTTQMATKTVIAMRNDAVPMKRAKSSDQRPKVSWFMPA